MSDDTMTDVVTTRELTKRYGSVLAVDGLTMNVRRGEIYGFLGPNGAGKTTALRMLLGLVSPTSGTARVLDAPPGSARALRKTGALVEAPGFYPFLSARDNLLVLTRHAGIPRSRIPAVLERVGLGDRAGDRFANYSQGMKQRLGVAAALLKEPTLLVLDEPTNGLDPAGMAEMRDLIGELRREGHTVLLSSHLMPEVEQVCDRVGVLNRGSLVAEGTVEQLRGGEDRLRVRAEPVADAERVLRDLPEVDGVDVADGALRVTVPAREAPSVNQALVRAGVSVWELRPERASLEEVFLTMTDSDRR